MIRVQFQFAQAVLGSDQLREAQYFIWFRRVMDYFLGITFMLTFKFEGAKNKNLIQILI